MTDPQGLAQDARAHGTPRRRDGPGARERAQTAFRALVALDYLRARHEQGARLAFRLLAGREVGPNWRKAVIEIEIRAEAAADRGGGARARTTERFEARLARAIRQATGG